MPAFTLRDNKAGDLARPTCTCRAKSISTGLSSGFLQKSKRTRLRFWLGWAQDLAGDHVAAQNSWRQARSELESFLKEQPDNFNVLTDLALTNMGLGDKAAALALAERAIAANPLEKDAVSGPSPIETLARVAARMGEPDRAIAALQKLLSIPAVTDTAAPFTPALLRLDPMFDPLRNDSRFQELVAPEVPR